MLCPKCKSINVREEKHHHVETIKNHVIEFDAPRMICRDCKSIVPDKELDFNAEIIKNDLGQHFDPVIGQIFIDCRPLLEAYYSSTVHEI